MIIKILKVPSDLKEEGFPEYINQEGYKCFKIKNGNINRIKRRLKIDFDFGKGVPDFFVYNKENSFFCEFKSNLDSFSLDQIMWAIRNYKAPLCWAIAIEKEDIEEGISFIEIDDKTEKETARINYCWKLKDKFLEKYLSAHQGLIGKKLFPYKGSYVGEIPTEVSIVWDKIDKSILKDKHTQNNLHIKQ